MVDVSVEAEEISPSKDSRAAGARPDCRIPDLEGASLDLIGDRSCRPKFEESSSHTAPGAINSAECLARSSPRTYLRSNYTTKCRYISRCDTGPLTQRSVEALHLRWKERNAELRRRGRDIPGKYQPWRGVPPKPGTQPPPSRLVLLTTVHPHSFVFVFLLHLSGLTSQVSSFPSSAFCQSRLLLLSLALSFPAQGCRPAIAACSPPICLFFPCLNTPISTLVVTTCSRTLNSSMAPRLLQVPSDL